MIRLSGCGSAGRLYTDAFYQSTGETRLTFRSQHYSEKRVQLARKIPLWNVCVENRKPRQRCPVFNWAELLKDNGRKQTDESILRRHLGAALCLLHPECRCNK